MALDTPYITLIVTPREIQAHPMSIYTDEEAEAFLQRHHEALRAYLEQQLSDWVAKTEKVESDQEEAAFGERLADDAAGLGHRVHLPDGQEGKGTMIAAIGSSATLADEFRKQVRATDLGENGDYLITMSDDSVVRAHDLRSDGVVLRPKDTPVTVYAYECWDKIPEEALPQAFYGSSPLGRPDCRCQKKGNSGEGLQAKIDLTKPEQCSLDELGEEE
jgi:hypothetical protein